MLEMDFERGSVTFIPRSHVSIDGLEAPDPDAGGNAARIDIPAHFRIYYNLRVQEDEDGIYNHNSIMLTVVVAASDESTPYRVIEESAAKDVPLLLRKIADEFERKSLEEAARIG